MQKQVENIIYERIACKTHHKNFRILWKSDKRMF